MEECASDRVSSGTTRFCVFIAELFIDRLFLARVSDVVFGMKATCCATVCKHCDRIPIAFSQCMNSQMRFDNVISPGVSLF